MQKKLQTPRVVIAGGHLTPAIALIQKLKNKDSQILYIGRHLASVTHNNPSIEKEAVTSYGCQFESIFEVKFNRYQKFASLLKLPLIFISIFQSIKLLHEYKSSVVVCFGGYLSVPISVAAKLLNIPIVLHEQTTTKGLANFIVSPLANKIAVGFPEAMSLYDHKKSFLIGNPIRQEILNPKILLKNNFQRSNLPIIYITGGNQGSHGLNLCLMPLINSLTKYYYIIHQTGSAMNQADFNQLLNIKRKLPSEKQSNYLVKPWFEANEVGQVLHNASLVISRSGANTITELICLGKPAILIPLKDSSQNEQFTNANILKKHKAGIVLLSEDLNPQSLMNNIRNMMSNLSITTEYAKQLSQLAPNHEQASQKLADMVMSYFSTKKV